MHFFVLPNKEVLNSHSFHTVNNVSPTFFLLLVNSYIFSNNIQRQVYVWNIMVLRSPGGPQRPILGFCQKKAKNSSNLLIWARTAPWRKKVKFFWHKPVKFSPYLTFLAKIFLRRSILTFGIFREFSIIWRTSKWHFPTWKIDENGHQPPSDYIFK